MDNVRHLWLGAYKNDDTLISYPKQSFPLIRVVGGQAWRNVSASIGLHSVIGNERRDHESRGPAYRSCCLQHVG